MSNRTGSVRNHHAAEDLFAQAREIKFGEENATNETEDIVEEAKALVKEAHELLKEAHEILMDILKDVREAGWHFGPCKDSELEDDEVYVIEEE